MEDDEFQDAVDEQMEMPAEGQTYTDEEGYTYMV